MGCERWIRVTGFWDNEGHRREERQYPGIHVYFESTGSDTIHPEVELDVGGVRLVAWYDAKELPYLVSLRVGNDLPSALLRVQEKGARKVFLFSVRINQVSPRSRGRTCTTK